MIRFFVKLKNSLLSQASTFLAIGYIIIFLLKPTIKRTIKKTYASLLHFCKKFSRELLLFTATALLLNYFLNMQIALAEIEDKKANSNINAKDNNTELSTSAPIYVMIHASDNTTFSSETTSTIQLINVKEGDSFKQNDVLLEFDCRISNAELQKAIAQEKLNQATLDSSKKLETYGSISTVEMIKAQAEAAIATSDVQKLSAVVDKCTIKAPYDGSVSELMVHVGETVKPGDPLMKILSSKNLEVQLQIPSIWLRWLRIGTTFKVKINELNKTLPVVVDKINPEINSISQTVKIVGRFPEPPPELLPGMSGIAIFNEGVKSAATSTKTKEKLSANWIFDNPPQIILSRGNYLEY